MAGFWWQLLGVFLARVGPFSHCHGIGLLVWGGFIIILIGRDVK